MKRMSLVVAGGLAAGLLAACAAPSWWPSSGPGFFVTSSNPGKGADFGGLAGADRHCQALGAATGAVNKTWRAYLSTTGPGGVNARDRIGSGPWRNVKGDVIASNVDELHTANRLTKQTALTEKGELVSGRGDAVNMHDILTGSMPDGRAASGAQDTTCGNWTRSGEGSALVGHHDRIGLRDDEPSRSWNSSHPSRGCGMDALKATGGAGLLYCFAAN
ncbi:MAG: hypothetical protein ACO1PB_15745 [Ramlibacter sp.]